MSVVHLHRPTKFPRKSMSAANMICRQYPDNEPVHKLVWGIIASYATRVVEYAELHVAVESLKYNLAKEKALRLSDRIDW